MGASIITACPASSRVRAYLQVRPRLAAGIAALFATHSLDHQRHVYDTRGRPLMWTSGVNWILSRQLTLSLLGVPHPQRKQVQEQHGGGVEGFVRDAVDYVARQLPFRDNFAALKAGLADHILLHTATVTEFLKATDECISKFVLLDHMDWMISYYPHALAEEWSCILRRATPQARIIFRSAHAAPGYLQHLELGPRHGRRQDHLVFHPGLAARLQRLDRVHTYAGFHIADLKA